MLLTDDERHRFITYLEQDAESNRLLIEQFAKLGPHLEPLAKAKRSEMMAELIVATMLRSSESQTIS